MKRGKGWRRGICYVLSCLGHGVLEGVFITMGCDVHLYGFALMSLCLVPDV